MCKWVHIDTVPGTDFIFLNKRPVPTSRSFLIKPGLQMTGRQQTGRIFDRSLHDRIRIRPVLNDRSVFLKTNRSEPV